MTSIRGNNTKTHRCASAKMASMATQPAISFASPTGPLWPSARASWRAISTGCGWRSPTAATPSGCACATATPLARPSGCACATTMPVTASVLASATPSATPSACAWATAPAPPTRARAPRATPGAARAAAATGRTPPPAAGAAPAPPQMAAPPQLAAGRRRRSRRAQPSRAGDEGCRRLRGRRRRRRRSAPSRPQGKGQRVQVQWYVHDTERLGRVTLRE
jgi:hypothetical protein